METLVAHGVNQVFGMVGHSNLGFADALRRAEQRGELTYIGIRHEGAAAFAASAYGKLTGRPAACFAIAGPRLPHPQPYRHQAGLAGIAAQSRMPVVTWPPSPQACPTVTGTLRAAKIPRG